MGELKEKKKKEETEKIPEDERDRRRESRHEGERWELWRTRREDSSTTSGSLRFLQKDRAKKHETTPVFREERLKRRGNREKEAANLPRIKSKPGSCCHNLRKVLFREGIEVMCEKFLSSSRWDKECKLAASRPLELSPLLRITGSKIGLSQRVPPQTNFFNTQPLKHRRKFNTQ